MKDGSLGKMTSQIRKKNFKVYTAKPIADAVKECLKMLSQSEQLKQNEDSAKGTAKLLKPITAHDTNQPIATRNTIERFGKIVELDRETGWSVILMLVNVTRDD